MKLFVSDFPNVPENISFANIGGIHYVRWSLPEDKDKSFDYPPVSSILMEVSEPNGGSWKKVAEIDGSSRSFEVPKWLYDGEYLVRLRAQNDAGLSKRSFETAEPLKFEKIKGW